MPEFRATASRPWRNSGGLRGIGVVDKRNLGRLHYRGDGETGRAGGEKEGRGGGWAGSAILQRKPWRWARAVYHSASEFVVPRLVTSQSFLPARHAKLLSLVVGNLPVKGRVRRVREISLFLSFSLFLVFLASFSSSSSFSSYLGKVKKFVFLLDDIVRIIGK